MSDTAESSNGPKILLVEDEPLIRMMTVEMLSVLGYATLEAGSASEALDFVNQGLDGVAALIIDLGLPDQPGENVIRHLRFRHPDLPVIVTTGANTAAAARRLGDCGILAFLEKPYDFNALDVHIARLPAAV